MSRMDPACFPQHDRFQDEPVCSECFSDEDIAAWIEDFGGPRGCAFCGKRDAPTAPVDAVASHMRACLLQLYGFADDQLPYESREGGYQGTHWDTHDLLFDELQLDLPRDINSKLYYRLPGLVGEEVWCDWDWLALDYDQALSYAWNDFCGLIKHTRRFFFMMQEADDDESFHPDDFPPLRLLGEIISLVEELDLVKTLAAGTEIYRARPWGEKGGFSTARELGPPPPQFATQANRMNPPGIPMTYAAETSDVAVCETRRSPVSVGRFRIERCARVLDLAELPEVPGVFAGAARKYRLGLLFMHAFTREITKPVDRDERVHIDYIPSQVVTEYIRSSKIGAEYIDGIRYPSSLQPRGRNLVLFASQEDFIEPDGTPVALPDQTSETKEPWIRLVEATQVTLSV